MQFLTESITSSCAPKRIAVKLNKKGELFLKKGHPWLFSDNIIKINTDAKSGDLAIIFDNSKNKVIGIGLYDANSPIRIKVLYNGNKPIKIDAAFFNSKIKLAFLKRQNLLKTNTNSYRLLFGENDGFPSLIADVYATVLVVKLYSEIWFPYLEIILKNLQNISQTKTIVIRLSRSLQQLSTHHLKDGEVVYGVLQNEEVKFIEHGVNFYANVIKGHKTGYFLDHRANRKQIGEWSKDKTVLDVFCYAGGFSVHALANNATKVTSVDISKQALKIALKNGKLNPHSGIHETIAGDAFIVMKKLIENKKQYDVVVIDPPSFAKQQTEINLAKKKYAQLAKLGTKLTAKNGLLVLASCSSRIAKQTFYDINSQAIKEEGRAFKTILKTQHDDDHPVVFLEGAYLKCGYYRFND